MKHLRQTHPEVDKYMYTCSVCREQSPILHQLSIHLETHKECLRYSCQLCPRQFSTAKRRVSHEVSKHKTQKCPHCEKTLTAQFYRDHLNLHTGKRHFMLTTIWIELFVKRPKAILDNKCSQAFRKFSYEPIFRREALSLLNLQSALQKQSFYYAPHE